MAKSFTNLQAGVRVYLDESSQADFTDFQVQRSVNYAYHDVVSKVMLVYREYYNAIVPFSYAIVKNVQEYTIDPSIINITRVEVNYAPLIANSVALRAVPIHMDEDLLNIANSAASGSVFSCGYYIRGATGGQVIGFIPIPQQSDTTGKSITVWANTIPMDMVSGSDLPNIPYPDNYGQLIELKAAAILMSKGQENDQNGIAGQYLARYAQGTNEMMQFLRDRQAEGAEVIQDVMGDNLDFETIPPW